MSKLYPLKFHTIFKEKIWGGQKIRTILGKDFGDLDNCGETWEISGVEGNVSIVSNGWLSGRPISEVIQDYGSEFLGKSILKRFGEEFPLLIKFIDAADDLSIQVHPDDTLAEERKLGRGKTEMWHVIDADEGASLISGFNKETDSEEYLDHFEKGTLMDILNREPAHDGDVFFLPAGRVHTIGKGLLLAEIQQTSDVTYRIYDFDREDKHGVKRVLHVEQALEAIDFSYHENYRTTYSESRNETNQVVKCEYFTTNKLILNESLTLDRSSLDCFKAYICLMGQGSIAGEEIGLGEVLLVPASISQVKVETTDMVLLETYIDQE